MNILPYLAEREIEVHAISLRGLGASQGKDRLLGAGLRTHVEVIKRSADGPGIRNPIAAGQFIGGLIAQHYVAVHPASALSPFASVPPDGSLRATMRS